MPLAASGCRAGRFADSLTALLRQAPAQHNPASNFTPMRSAPARMLY